MTNTNKTNITIGILLVLLGAFFLVVQWFPNFASWVNPALNWPLIVIGVGVVFLFVAIVGNAAFAIPASILVGIGALLYWQNASDNYESWAYAWTLIPGFVGVGLTLRGLLGSHRDAMQGGLWLVFISAVMFLAFGSFFGALGLLGMYWPLLLVALGLLLMARPLIWRAGDQNG